MHIDVPCISMELNLKNPSTIVFNKVLRKTIKIDFKNSSKMEFCFFETKIVYFIGNAQGCNNNYTYQNIPIILHIVQ